jgi:hypothetical protein
LTARLEKTILIKKMIEVDLSWIKESATKSIYKLGIGFEKCVDKGKKSALKFIPSSTYQRKKQSNPPKPAIHLIKSHPSTQREM